MKKLQKTLSISLKRVIAGPPSKVFEAWLDPSQPCNPWNSGKTLGLEPRPGALFCIMKGSAAYVFGRILKLAKGRQVEYSWMSPYTHGVETRVMVQFKKHASGTLMTLRHTGLPNDGHGRAHGSGWEQFLGMMEGYFSVSRTAKEAL